MTVNKIEIHIAFMDENELGYYVFAELPEFEGTDDEMKFGSEINPDLKGIEYGPTAIENGGYQDQWDIDKRDGQCGYYFKREEDAQRFAEVIKKNLK